MNAGIDLLRHLFALAVIAQHMASASRYSPATNQGLTLFADWVDGAVLGFFLISGFLFKVPDSLPAYCKKQSVRLLVPFFLFSTIYASALAALGKADLAAGLKDTVLLRGAGMQLYYLPELLLVGTVVATLHALFRDLGRSRLFPYSLALLACLAAIALPTGPSTGPDLRLLPLYLLAFLIGNVIRQFDQERLRFRATLLAGVVAAIVGFVDHRFFDLAGVVILLGVFLVIFSRLSGRRVPGSGGVYLLHTPIVNFAVSTFLLKLSIGEGANIALSVLATYAICLGFTLLLAKFCPRHRWLMLEQNQRPLKPTPEGGTRADVPLHRSRPN